MKAFVPAGGWPKLQFCPSSQPPAGHRLAEAHAPVVTFVVALAGLPTRLTLTLYSVPPHFVPLTGTLATPDQLEPLGTVGVWVSSWLPEAHASPVLATFQQTLYSTPRWAFHEISNSDPFLLLVTLRPKPAVRQSTGAEDGAAGPAGTARRVASPSALRAACRTPFPPSRNRASRPKDAASLPPSGRRFE